MMKWLLNWILGQFLTKDNLTKIVSGLGTLLLTKCGDATTCKSIGDKVQLAGKLIATLGDNMADGQLTADEVNAVVTTAEQAIGNTTDSMLTTARKWIISKL